MWNANIERLKAIKAQNLPNAGTSSQDPLFWDYLTKLANALTTTTTDEKYRFIDDHRIRLLDEDQISSTDLEKASESLESIIVCRRMFNTGAYKKSSDAKDHYGPWHPLAWIFPGPYTWSECQCKNPLYIKDGREIRGRKLEARKPKEAFPRGSLLKYLTPERDKDQLAILAGCVLVPVESK